MSVLKRTRSGFSEIINWETKASEKEQEEDININGSSDRDEDEDLPWQIFEYFGV
jgi:hypothetical protein